ncbi:MAG: putative mycofactocin binding protein MftB [Haloarculaceae archaeon]|jgi:putative mycofactocin binding protein MftB
MSDTVVVPDHVKYRREETGGLVYTHENYGYEDATLTSVGSSVIDVLEHVNENSGCNASELQSSFSAETVDVLVDRGFVTYE